MVIPNFRLLLIKFETFINRIFNKCFKQRKIDRSFTNGLKKLGWYEIFYYNNYHEIIWANLNRRGIRRDDVIKTYFVSNLVYSKKEDNLNVNSKI